MGSGAYRQMWDKWVDEGKKSPYLGPYMPSDPQEMYSGSGWTDWQVNPKP